MPDKTLVAALEGDTRLFATPDNEYHELLSVIRVWSDGSVDKLWIQNLPNVSATTEEIDYRGR